jgi:AcrR family transcriptional regulator
MWGSSQSGIAVPVRPEIYGTPVPFVKFSRYDQREMATTMRADALRNRQRILDAAREAFTEHGEQAQMDDIARRVGLGAGTLYRHFKTKDALVGELIRLKLSEMAERVRTKFEEETDPWAAFEGGFREQVDVMARDASHQNMTFVATPDALRIAAPAVAGLRDAWDAVIARAKEAGVLREDLTVDDIRTMMCGLGGMMAADSRGAMSFDWRRQVDLFLNGVHISPS